MVCLSEVTCDKCRKTFEGDLHARHHICCDCQKAIEDKEKAEYEAEKEDYMNAFYHPDSQTCMELAGEIFDLRKELEEVRSQLHSHEWDM